MSVHRGTTGWASIGSRGGEDRAMLLAAGLGTRLKPLTDRVPKCLIPVAGKPVLEHWEDSLVRAGIRHARVNTHHLASEVRDFAQSRNRIGRVRWETVHEESLLGSAGTIASNSDYAEGARRLLVIYADTISDVDLADLMAHHDATGAELTMALFRAPDPRSCGIASLDNAGRVVAFEEKPPHPAGNLAFAGVLVMTSAMWREIADMSAFDIGFDVLPRLVGRMHGFTIDGYHQDIGSREALESAESFIRRRSLGQQL